MGQYKSDDIAIVSLGVTLPQSDNYEEFKKVLFLGENVFSEIHRDRWKVERMFDPDKNVPNKVYSTLSSQITPERVNEIKQRYGLDSKEYRATAYMCESYGQILDELSLKQFSNTAMIVGSMGPSEEVFHEHMAYVNRKVETDYIAGKISENGRNHFNDFMKEESVHSVVRTQDGVFSTSVYKKMEDAFKGKFPKQRFFIDSACSSSLTSLEIGVNLLKTREKDLVIVGGVEANLSAGAFLTFSKVGALTSSICRPFDTRHDGIVQGEGCVLFAIERLEDAIKNKRNIRAIVKGVNGSSDGRSASLFQPTVLGQEVVYRKVWEKINASPFYIEAHGTGTVVGDTVEAESISNYFKQDNLYIGSIKSIFGHTKSCAGATSILKAIAIFEENKIPGNPYVEETILDSNPSIKINKEEVKISNDDKFIGISSLGFGGTNYHTAIQRYEKKTELIKNVSSQMIDTFDVVKKVEVKLQDIRDKKLSKNYFPPQSFDQIDLLQIAAVESVYQMFSNTEELVEGIGQEKVNVVSCGIIGVEKLADLARTTATTNFHEYLKGKNYSKKDSRYIQEKLAELPMVNEDSGPGILNNVIAGRVTNYFNIRGKNYHVDMDISSVSAAFYSVALDLSNDPSEVFIVVDTTGKCGGDDILLEPEIVTAYLVCHPKLTASLGLGKIGEYNYEK